MFYLFFFFLQFLVNTLFLFPITETQNQILGREATAQTKGPEFRLGNGSSDVKR